MKLNSWTPIGGHLTHLVPAGQDTALCGFKPSAKIAGRGRLMKRRHGWNRLPSIRSCKACLKAQEKP